MGKDPDDFLKTLQEASASTAKAPPSTVRTMPAPSNADSIGTMPAPSKADTALAQAESSAKQKVPQLNLERVGGGSSSSKQISNNTAEAAANGVASASKKGAQALLKGLRSGDVSKIIDKMGGEDAGAEQNVSSTKSSASRRPSDMIRDPSRARDSDAAPVIIPPEKTRSFYYNMATSQQATMHASLSQLAAFLRESKENQNQVREDTTDYASELEELRQETSLWKGESQRLSRMARDLEQQLQLKLHGSSTASGQRKRHSLRGSLNSRGLA